MIQSFCLFHKPKGVISLQCSIRKHVILRKIEEKGVVAVIRAKNKDEGRKLSEAVFRGGIPAVEITMTVPGALDIIKDLSGISDSNGMILGAGTVIDAETARLCILAGASYVVTPFLSAEVLRMCNRYSVPCLPGTGTVAEIVSAMELGADVVKIFPGEVLGPSFIKAALGPLPNAKMMPTGGVSPDNLEEWIKAGAFAVGMGGALTNPATRNGDYLKVEEIARAVVRKIGQIRQAVE